MKNLKVDYTDTAFAYKDKVPSDAFFKELSKQLTAKVVNLINDEVLRINSSKLICFSMEKDSYTEIQYRSNPNCMHLELMSLLDALVLCKFIVRWYTDTQIDVYPWEDPPKNAIHFELSISRSEINRLNEFLPELYHPIVKSKESGLPFDYQIYYGGENLVISFYSPPTSEEVKEINNILDSFFKTWNETHERKIHMFDVKKQSKLKIKCSIDFGGCDEDALEAMIRSFRFQSNIKKITCR